MTLMNRSQHEQTWDGAPRPRYEIAAARIVELITTAGLKAGDRLPTERALSEQLGVSRTVVREAVKVLAATGIVRTHQGSGLYVHNDPQSFKTAAIDISMSVDPKDINSLFEFRLMLELQTAYLAAERITPKELLALQDIVENNRVYAEAQNFDLFHETDTAFHMTIAESTRNPFLVSAIATVHRLQNWAVQIVAGGTPGSMQFAAEEHHTILVAIRSGQPEQAREAMRTHIQTVMTSYEQAVRRRLLQEDIVQ